MKVQRGSTDADPSFVVGDTDYTIQRYTETQMYSGALFDTGGGESLEEFHNRGQILHYVWPRDGTDASTRCTINSQFANGTDVTNMQVLLFDHSRQVARIRIQNGSVTGVELEDA